MGFSLREMDSQQLKDRTKRFAISIIKFSQTLSRDLANQVIIKQILRSATSVAANYRAACRGKSTADFINKINIVEEEADETHLWLELLHDTDNSHSLETLKALIDEANQLTAIFTAIGRSTKSRAHS